MSKGYLWFCQNTENVDYISLSIELARTIKKHNKENSVCVIVDKDTTFENKWIDHVKVLATDHADGHEKKFSNEYKAFALTPFTHTIKLEADMIWNSNTDWWWNYLCQHDLVFSINCLDYKEQVVRDEVYRPFHRENLLPNVYNGMTYFRRSHRAKKFFDICRLIFENWTMVQENLLKKCFDQHPSTDIVYALAYRLLDPTCEQLIDYSWFKFIHNKPCIHQKDYDYDPKNYYYPLRIDDEIVFGGRKLSAPLHYFNKDFVEVLNARSV